MLNRFSGLEIRAKRLTGNGNNRKLGTAPPGFFRELCVAGHSQQAHFDVKRDSRGGRFIHGVKAETTETRSS